MAFFERQPFSMSALKDFSPLEPKVQKHLKNVYASLAMTTASAAVGAFLNVSGLFLGGQTMAFIGGLGGLGLTMYMAATHNARAPVTAQRLGVLAGVGFATGMSLGPLLSAVVMINPSIIMTAFLATSVMFGCFSAAALMAKERSYLYLGGMLSSALMMLCGMGLANIFFQSQMMFQMQLYGGLLIFSGFIVFDTQMIVEKSKRGDMDYAWHALDLFIDFVNVFKHLLIILAQNNGDKKKNRRR